MDDQPRDDDESTMPKRKGILKIPSQKSKPAEQVASTPFCIRPPGPGKIRAMSALDAPTAQTSIGGAGQLKVKDDPKCKVTTTKEMATPRYDMADRDIGGYTCIIGKNTACKMCHRHKVLVHPDGRAAKETRARKQPSKFEYVMIPDNNELRTQMEVLENGMTTLEEEVKWLGRFGQLQLWLPFDNKDKAGDNSTTQVRPSTDTGVIDTPDHGCWRFTFQPASPQQSAPPLLTSPPLILDTPSHTSTLTNLARTPEATSMEVAPLGYCRLLAGKQSAKAESSPMDADEHKLPALTEKDVMEILESGLDA
ncbi:hypothetical protein V8E55_002687 [Tylopilus felleus]